jgi:hypothetical protein
MNKEMKLRKKIEGSIKGNPRPLSGLEKKYGRNDLDRLVFCPRCADAVPVFLRTISDRFSETREAHCLKCRYYGHKDGTFINKLEEG